MHSLLSQLNNLLISPYLMINKITQALREVFSKKSYVVMALLTSLIIIVFSIWLPNLKLIWSVLLSSVDLSKKLSFILSLLNSISTNFSLFSAINLVVIAIMFGVSFAMTVYSIKRRTVKTKVIGTGLFGLLSGVFGIGCAACGSVLLMSLPIIGLNGLAAALPFGGSEFGLVGIFVLGISIYINCKEINKPILCKINQH